MGPAADEPGYNLATSNQTFPQLLKRAGYATATCGKWQLAGSVAEHGFDEASLWQRYPGFDGPVETETNGGRAGRAARYWHPAVVENGSPVPTTPNDYGPDLFVEFLLDFARRHRDQPFLIFYSMLLPHTAWDFGREVEDYLAVPTAGGEHDPGATPGGVTEVQHRVYRRAGREASCAASTASTCASGRCCSSPATTAREATARTARYASAGRGCR